MPLEYLLVIGAVMVNLFLSWWNCKAVGSIWYESKQAGGSRRFMAWMGAIMAGAGFTWCYFIIVGVALAASGKIDEQQLHVLFDIGYLLVIMFVLPSGLALTFNQWKQTFHEKTVGNLAAAGWDTFATGYNAYHAISGVPAAFGDMMKNLRLSNSKNAQGLAMLFIVLLAIALAFSGVVTAVLLIKHYAARTPLEELHPDRDYSDTRQFA